MSKGEFITDGIVPLRGVVRDGELAAILDHEGDELGAPVTSKRNEVTGGSRFLGQDGEVFQRKNGRPNILFIGDSIPGYGYAEDGIFSIMSTSGSPYGAGAFSIDGVSWACGYGSGTLNFNKAAQTLKWSPNLATGSFGSNVDVSVAGIYKIPGPSANQWIKVICRPRLYAASTDGDFTVTVTQYTELARYGAKSPASYLKAFTGYNIYVYASGGSQIADLTDSLWQLDDFGVDFDAVVLQIGTNNIASDFTLAQMQTDFTALIAGLKAYAPLRFVNLIIPRSASMSTARRQTLFGTNRWLMSLQLDGVRPVDVFTPLVDVTSANSDPISGALEDGVHPQQLGAEILGKTDAVQLLKQFGDVVMVASGIADTYHATNNPYGNAIASLSGFTGTGGTVGAGMTGPVPDGYYLERNSGANITAVLTMVARPDGKNGSCPKIAITGSTSRQIAQLRIISAISVLPGEKWVGKCRIYKEDFVGIEQVQLLVDPGLGGGEKVCGWGTTSAVANMSSNDEYLYLDTPPLVIPASGITGIRLYLRFIASSTGTGSIYLMPGEISLERVP